MFQPATECMACHNSLTTSSGEDVSIGIAWRASMMANSSRDPYWQASVRRETIDHPTAAVEIEHECATCHMPMSSATARAQDRRAAVFAHLPVGERSSDEDRLAADGVGIVAPLDADDVWLPTKLERQVRLFRARPDLGVAFTRRSLIDAAGRILPYEQPAFPRGRCLRGV